MRKSFFLLLISILFVLGQRMVCAQTAHELRLTEIEESLNVMADSVTPGLNQTAEFSVVKASLQDLIRGLAEIHELNVSVEPDINVKITNNFTNVTVKDLIIFLCKEYRLDITFINNILSFKNFEVPIVKKDPVVRLPNIVYNKNTDELSVDLKGDSLSLFVRELTRVSGKNVIMAPNVKERVMNGLISKVSFDIGLSKIAFTNSLELEISDGDGFYILKNPDNLLSKGELNGNKNRKGLTRKDIKVNKNTRDQGLYVELSMDSLLNVEAINVPVIDVIKEAAYLAGVDYIFLSKPEGNAFTKIDSIAFHDLLEFLLQNTQHTYLNKEGVYIIGNKLDEGFRITKLVKFDYRPAWEMEKVIPQALMQNVQVAPFEELNALILSGSANIIKEIELFLNTIDQPVPNIMIDVIVIDARKNYSIQTGLSAFLSDSVVTTNGQVFPGMDLTMGGGSINKVLDKVSDYSAVNLGRVKPNFYVTLKALEQNGNIKIRSTPKLSTLNGHEAQLTIGKSVYYLEQTQNVTGGVNPIITTTPRFSKVEADLTIKIKPMVSGDDNVTLNIEAEFSDFIPPEIENAPPGNATRKFVSQIRVLNEEVILLGGLEEARKEKTNSGFPILSRIPVLKWIFSSKVDSNSDDKLLVLIKPKIVY